MERNCIFTIGYGGRRIDLFIDLLIKYDVNFLVDIRSYPYSRFQADYRRDQLKSHLINAGISYLFLGHLLGGKPKDPTCYTFGKIDYHKIKDKEFYLNGIKTLKSLYNETYTIALLCAELKFQDCHRNTLVAKSMRRENIHVFHINEKGELQSDNEE